MRNLDSLSCHCFASPQLHFALDPAVPLLASLREQSQSAALRTPCGRDESDLYTAATTATMASLARMMATSSDRQVCQAIPSAAWPHKAKQTNLAHDPLRVHLNPNLGQAAHTADAMQVSHPDVTRRSSLNADFPLHLDSLRDFESVSEKQRRQQQKACASCCCAAAGAPQKSEGAAGLWRIASL